MELWKAVCKTDPKYTKQVSQKGGFTAICAQYQLGLATEQWGPYGINWGVYDLEWGEVRDGQGELLEVTLDARFQFPGGHFPISACCAYRVGGDTRKKLLTDLTTKALSKLGFNADVFLGRFDDNKYVQAMAQHFGGNGGSKPAPQPQGNGGAKAQPAAQAQKQQPLDPPAVVRSGRQTLAPLSEESWSAAILDGDGTPWLSENSFPFGKYKGTTWHQFFSAAAEKGDESGHYSYLEWALENFHPHQKGDGTPIQKPEWRLEAEIRLARAIAILDYVDGLDAAKNFDEPPKEYADIDDNPFDVPSVRDDVPVGRSFDDEDVPF
ncbi:MAG: hypothetical protein GY856_36875 [bacterium]|nr:hypothetical protein [bacterium]